MSLLAGGLISYAITLNSFSDDRKALQNQISNLQTQTQTLQENVNHLQTELTATTANTTGNNATLEQLSATITEAQNKLSSLQQQINNQPASDLSQNITALNSEIAAIQNTLSLIQQQINTPQATNSPTVIYQNITYVSGEDFSLSQLFDQVKASVVVVQGKIRQVDFLGRVYYTQIQGSGFVYNQAGRSVILTNNHVISGAINITATFTDGTIFSMTVLGTNSTADIAILTPTTSIAAYKPLEIISSTTLRVGDPVIVVGTPYGLAGSMSNGIVSALNRTLTTDTNTEISNIIQTTAPLNPGNSGGPVMNYKGQVVGIATAIASESQGIGFAVPSDSILSELQRVLST